MFCVIFRFTLNDIPESEPRFITAWEGITQFFQAEAGALSSALHKDADGHYISYAKWPDAQSYHRSQDVPRSQDFIRHAVEWSEVCAPSEIIFEGEMISDQAL